MLYFYHGSWVFLGLVAIYRVGRGKDFSLGNKHESTVRIMLAIFIRRFSRVIALCTTVNGHLIAIKVLRVSK